MSRPTAIRRLAAFVAGHPRGGFAQAHLDRASDAFLDTLGCMLLGRDAPVTRAALAACADWGVGPAPLPGTAHRLPPPWAALVGGAAAHAFDLDDYTLVANDHPSAVMVPALIAHAATAPDKISGMALLDAYLVGLEVIFRAGAAVNMGHYNLGWHSTSTLDSLGATAAIARLSGLPAGAAAHALSVTTSLGSGFVSQFGTMAKPLHAGISAKTGLVACALARAGATASETVLDGPVSLSAIMAPEGITGFDAALSGLGTTWGLDRFGLGAKLYPSCGYTHRAIDGALELRARLGVPHVDDIASVALSLPDFHLAILPFGVPETPDQALFSAPWCAAVALATGQCSSADFTEAGLRREGVRALAARITATGRAPRDPAINLDPADPDTVRVTLRDGTVAEASVKLWTGAPGRDLSRAQLVEKFQGSCDTVRIDTGQRDRLADTVLGLAGQRSVTRFLRLLGPCADPGGAAAQ